MYGTSWSHSYPVAEEPPLAHFGPRYHSSFLGDSVRYERVASGGYRLVEERVPSVRAVGSLYGTQRLPYYSTSYSGYQGQYTEPTFLEHRTLQSGPLRFGSSSLLGTALPSCADRKLGASSVSIVSKAQKASYHENVLGCIGQTPMVKLNRLVDGLEVGKVLIKLEMQNPGGSVKDRIAKEMIEDAELQGIISPEKTTVIEYTSGNTGIGLAMVCAAKGYRCIIVMPQVPAMKERYMICRKFGAAIHLTAACKGIKGAEDYVNEQLEKHAGYWCPRQFRNPANPKAHFEHTGPEIWEQTGGDIDFLVAGAGTGGTVSALARYLKGRKPDVKVILVEPTESRVLVGGKHSAHSIVGIGAGFPLPFIEELAPGQEWKEGSRGVIDEFQHCSGPEAVVAADKMAAKEGLLVGPTSGAAVKVALDVAQRPEAKGKTIVVICASSAIRYVNHPLWAAMREEGDNALPTPANMDPEPLLRWESPEE